MWLIGGSGLHARLLVLLLLFATFSRFIITVFQLNNSGSPGILMSKIIPNRPKYVPGVYCVKFYGKGFSERNLYE